MKAATNAETRDRESGFLRPVHLGRALKNHQEQQTEALVGLGERQVQFVALLYWSVAFVSRFGEMKSIFQP